MKMKPQNRTMPKAVSDTITGLRTTFNKSIQATCEIAPYCCNDPKRDFTRKRQLPFESVIKQVLTFQNEALQNELFDFFQNQKTAPTKSAFIQQRHKIKTEAFDFLYHNFMDNVKLKKRFLGYYLYACDGSIINLPRNPDDFSTSVSAKPGSKSYNRVNLNALYDLVNKVYVSYRIDNGAHARELDALYEMAPSIQDPEHSILTADRGYGYFNTIAFLANLHCHFVIRVKDTTSCTSFMRQLNLPNSEFDKEVDIILTKSHKKQFLNDSKHLSLCGKNSFDYFDTNGFANLLFRVARFKLPSGEYETVITDLTCSEFPADAIKQIYNLRWGIETSFRDLKYALNLVFFHSKKYNFIIQELISRILMYNLYSLMIQCVPDKCNPDLKYIYKANFLASIGSLREFFLFGNRDILHRLLYNMNPVRPNRTVPRGNLHDTKPAKSFNYRAS